MQFFSAFDPVLGMAALLALLLAVLIALEIYNGKRVQKLAYPAYEYALKQAQQEADRIVAEARTQARQLVEKAEADSAAYVGSHKAEDDAAEQQYRQALQSMLTTLDAELKESAHAAHEAGERASAAMTTQLEAQSKEARERFAAASATLEKQAAARLDEQMASVFAVADKEVKAYEQARKNAVDTHILALVNETVKLTLQKTLSKDVHAELVRAALEEAKSQQVF